MFIVRGMTKTGSVSCACGTAEQALEKLLELIGRRLQEITVTDPKGRCMTADEFLRVTEE
jgi:hypothetical protein